jgi:hypothetical protein
VPCLIGLAAALSVLVLGCGFGSDGVWVEPAAAEPNASTIAKAIHYLSAIQVSPEEELQFGEDYAGDWPQYIVADVAPSIYVRDNSPFIPTFIHHALSWVTEERITVLGLSPADVDAARVMRRNAADMMRRFEAPADDPAAGTYGFWPATAEVRSGGDALLSELLQAIFRGPVFNGTRSPANIHAYPPAFAFPTDADDTAMVYAALLDDHVLDGGPVLDPPLDRYVSEWRYLGEVPLWFQPDWLVPDSGVFLTWLPYGDSPDDPTPNDVDLIVNADVLYALGRLGHLDTPGVDEAVAMINTMTAAGYHVTHLEEISRYYSLPNYAFHYCVSRAYYEGPVPALKPAVEQLADELEAAVLIAPDGTRYWDQGSPHLSTAFAVLTLLNAGRDGPLVDAALEYLAGQQDPTYGNWGEDVFIGGRMLNGTMIRWHSQALTTGIALEAFCRQRLAHGGPA